MAQPQVQQAAAMPREAVGAPRRHEVVIDLVSDDEGSEGDEEFYEAEEYEPQLFIRDRQRQEAFRPEAPLQDWLPPQQPVADQYNNAVPPALRPAGPVDPLPGARDAEWGDYMFDDDIFDSEAFQRVINNQNFAFQAQAFAAANAAPAMQPAPRQAPSPYEQLQQQPANAPSANELANAETQDECVQAVAMVFPGICLDHVSELYKKIKSSERLIAHILDQMDKGILYPKAKDKAKDLKRKRIIDKDEEAARKYGAADRVVPPDMGGTRHYVRNILSQEFPQTPMSFIDLCLNKSSNRLFSAYRLLHEADRDYGPGSEYQKLRSSRKVTTDFQAENMEILLSNPNGDMQYAEVLRELQAARRAKENAEEKHRAEVAAQREEEDNERKAQAEGTMQECGCCFGDFPRNRMIHCDSEFMHWFCRSCALRNAETEVGQSKYELTCMSMEGCSAPFTISQRNIFLDEKTKIALERNEQEANLRLAGIENLASCPFCPFAAEYPPVEIDREFRCIAPDCEKVSCRLCKLESHIPKTCEENAKETGLSVRRRVEEAMSAALIRKCNKCGTPFIKEEGCNKMRCTLAGCGNIQCYVCSKSCDYEHFDDRNRGGKQGNCPLFESVETRHDQEVSKAEKEALDMIRAEHPEYTEDDLKIKVSEAVQKDDAARKAKDPRGVAGLIPGYRFAPRNEGHWRAFLAEAEGQRLHPRFFGPPEGAELVNGGPIIHAPQAPQLHLGGAAGRGIARARARAAVRRQNNGVDVPDEPNGLIGFDLELEPEDFLQQMLDDPDVARGRLIVMPPLPVPGAKELVADGDLAAPDKNARPPGSVGIAPGDPEVFKRRLPRLLVPGFPEYRQNLGGMDMPAPDNFAIPPLPLPPARNYRVQIVPSVPVPQWENQGGGVIPRRQLPWLARAMMPPPTGPQTVGAAGRDLRLAAMETQIAQGKAAHCAKMKELQDLKDLVHAELSPQERAQQNPVDNAAFIRRQADRVAKAEEIFNHAERRVQRNAEMLRLQREQENDMAATARRLDEIKQRNADFQQQRNELKTYQAADQRREALERDPIQPFALNDGGARPAPIAPPPQNNDNPAALLAPLAAEDPYDDFFNFLHADDNAARWGDAVDDDNDLWFG